MEVTKTLKQGREGFRERKGQAGVAYEFHLCVRKASDLTLKIAAAVGRPRPEKTLT